MHVIHRGNDRMACFRHDGDYLVYLALLRELAAKFRCAVHAYCLMTNHVHVLLTPESTDGCSRLMKNLGQRYVQYFNREHTRTGTLWEGRFRSCLTESARYVIACYRYIEMNPVRAGMVKHPGEYAWSSYAVNVGLHRDALVSPHIEFRVLGRGYAALFGEALDDPTLFAIRDATNGGYPLVSDAFRSRLTTKRKLVRESPGPKPVVQTRSGSDPDLFGS
jgi:putative transposase